MEGEFEDSLSKEDKASLEKNKKRKLKTPAQLMALEKFYNEHKYPTEEMKAELAEELGLTEKQISGWFCHRRLKDKRLMRDESCANGRQDRSSGVIQDHGSGFGQDSCGSTKHGDFRHIDAKEVESRGLYSRDFLVGDLTNEQRSHHTENDTSSESSSSLQDGMFSQNQDPYNMEPSSYLIHNGVLPPLNSKSSINMGYKPSGYLKVKGEIENAAITAVKKQLGRHYRDDGPPLGIEFDSLPPGAFESQIADMVHEKPYYVGNAALPNAPVIPSMRQPNLGIRYELRNSKFSSEDSHLEGANIGTMHKSDFQEPKSHQHKKHRFTSQNHANSFRGKNSALDMDDVFMGEASTHFSSSNLRRISKHGIEGMRCDSASNHSGQYEEKFANGPTEHPLHDYDNVSQEFAHRSEYSKSKPSKLKHNRRDSVDTEDRGLPMRMAKEDKILGDRQVMKEYHDKVRNRMHPINETNVVKRTRCDLPLPDNMKQDPVAEMLPQKNPRSTAEIPSSFSEDETAETSSSLD